MRLHILATGISLAMAAQPIHADDHWGLCPAAPEPAFVPGPEAGLDRAVAPLRLSADLMDGERDGGRLTGNVLMQHADRSLSADRLHYDRDSGAVHAEGSISYRDRSLEITGSRATLLTDPDLIRFDALDYRLHRLQGRGSAASLEARDDGVVTLTGVGFTTCPEGGEAWMLNAPSIELDTEAGIGIARNVRVEFHGIPILYSPWLSFPLNDDRKTGFLMPDIGRARNTGIDIRVPWYWNISPNMDATLTPRWIQFRGAQLIGEYRYLTESSTGVVDFEVLPNDRRTGDTRTLFAWEHLTSFSPGWQFSLDLNHTGDADYFEDLAGSLDLTVITHLRREAAVTYEGNTHRFTGRVDGWQTLDRDIVDADRPYMRLPQLLWQVRVPVAQRGPLLTLDSELVAFDSTADRLTGVRLDLEPAVSWPLTGAGWHLIPGASWRHTRYQLEDPFAPLADDRPSRSLPTYSLDAGLVFERELGGQRIQTLEPRMYWLRIPYRDQDALPLFDTSMSDFNMVQLFHRNRFNGADRIGDADQVSLGLVSRIYSPVSGRELLQLQAGRIRHFSDRRVALPGDPVDTRDWSDVLFEGQAALSERWSARAGAQYDPDSGRFERSLVQLRWHPDQQRLLNLGWRFRRGQIDQTDLSFMWPLSERWSAIGRWNWSVEDRRSLETLAGFEYQSCCWAVRVVSRQYIANRAGDSNRSLYLQLELKGLANIGRGIEGLLGRGILQHP